MVEILQNFVAFSEYMNFKCSRVQNMMSSKFTGPDTRANASPDKKRAICQENWKICLRRM